MLVMEMLEISGLISDIFLAYRDLGSFIYETITFLTLAFQNLTFLWEPKCFKTCMQCTHGVVGKLVTNANTE